MTPDYIEHLANLADPKELWRRSPLEELTLEAAQQRDTGVALRRHAANTRRVNELLGTGYSLCITPLGLHGTASKIIPTPCQPVARARPCADD